MNYAQEGASIFCKKFGIRTDSVIHSDVAKMIDIEAQAEIDRGVFKGQRNQWRKALDVALERVCDWYESGMEYNIDPVHEFVASHRQACCYAVLLRQGKFAQLKR